MHDLENYTINVKLITDIDQVTPLHDGVEIKVN
jgi:hypothetical protein